MFNSRSIADVLIFIEEKSKMINAKQKFIEYLNTDTALLSPQVIEMAHEVGVTIHTFVDGKEIENVYMASKETGAVGALVLDPDGKPQQDPKLPDSPLMKEYDGVVTFEVE